MSAPIFSVVTPSFNQGAYVEACIQSVLEQGEREFEHLIIDNCSTDETLEIVRRYPHVRCISEPDRGQAHALNKGFQLAQGRICCWLNADDRYAPGAWKVARRELLERGCSVIFGNAREVFFDGRAERIQYPRFSAPADLLRWWDKEVSLLQPSIFFTRDVFEAVGPLREDLHVVMDLEYWWRVSQQFTFHYVDEVLSIQLRQPDSKTIKGVYRMYREKQAVFSTLRREQEGFRLSTWWQSRWALGRRFRQLAEFAGDRQSAFFFLRQSACEHPLQLITPAWWMCALWWLGRQKLEGSVAA